MIEGHLNEGRQDIVPGQPLQHGVSVTDAGISFEQTVPVLESLAAAVRARRSRGTADWNVAKIHPHSLPRRPGDFALRNSCAHRHP